jgi:hypothetical protein
MLLLLVLLPLLLLLAAAVGTSAATPAQGTSRMCATSGSAAKIPLSPPPN